MYKKNKPVFWFLLFFIAMHSCIVAQNLPACIMALKNPNSEFKKKVKLHDGRSVYAVSIKRPPKCMDCASGTVYYDSTCTTVASFTIGFAPMASIRPGYSASDFPEASSPMFASRLAATAIPSCITAAIAKPDSLRSAGIVSVDEVLIAGKRLYYFQTPVVDKKGCYDCATTVAYYDSVCRIAAVFKVGGYAGIEPPRGFTKQDFTGKRKLRTLWSSGTNSPISAGNALNPFPQPVTFTITQVVDTLMEVFKNGDELKISTAEGLYHYSGGKLANRYKIIPQKIKQQKTNPCLVPPCPVQEQEQIVYYLEPLQRYFYIDQLSDRAWLHFSRKKFSAANAASFFKEDDWNTGFRLRKK